MRIVKLLLIGLLGPFCLAAQPALEGGLILGGANYQGDFTLDNSPKLSETNVSIGLIARHPLTKKHAIRVNLSFLKLSGDDQNYEVRQSRAASFETKVFELSVLGEWEPFGDVRRDITLEFGQRLSPYFFGGIGVAFINPETVFGEIPGEKALEDINADFSKAQFVLPIGLGLRAGLGLKTSLSLELGMRKTFSDYLDGLSEAGRPGNNDWYLFGGVMFLYEIWKGDIRSGY